jgi:hypothetical protein
LKRKKHADSWGTYKTFAPSLLCAPKTSSIECFSKSAQQRSAVEDFFSRGLRRKRAADYWFSYRGGPVRLGGLFARHNFSNELIS